MFPAGSDPFYITGLSGGVFAMLFNTINDMKSVMDGETTYADIEIVLSFYGTAGTEQGNGTPTPEPATLAVLGLGLAGLGTVARRRRK